MQRDFNDPMERMIASSLKQAGIAFISEVQDGNPSGLDFRLGNGIEIEVKRFHSPRIADQMSRADNVIAIQGELAVKFFAELLRAHRIGD